MPSAEPRVLVLTTYYRPVVGGVESGAERLAQYLRAQGLPVQILTKRITTDLPDVEAIDGILVRRIGAFGHRSPSAKWRFLPAVTSWLARHAADYDVVCSVDYRALGLGAIAARAVTRRPVIFQAGTTGVLSAANADEALARLGIQPRGRVARALKWPIVSLYRRADAYACVSHEIEREARACGIPASRVHFLPNPVDMHRFCPATGSERQALRRELGVGADTVVCVFAGRLSREKGVAELMEAWRLLQTSPAPSSRAQLIVAGPDMDGHAWNEGPAARAFVAKHGLHGSVRFLGPLDDTAPLLRTADLAVQPSHFEALGLSAIEALACGVPVVASAVGGLLDFMVDGGNGRLCEPKNPRDLAAALGAVIRDAELRRRLAGQARASVATQYDGRDVCARFGAVIRQLASAHAQPATPTRTGSGAVRAN